MADPDVLATEKQTYREHKDTLVRDHLGEFVLIQGQNVVGTFATNSAAVAAGYDNFGIEVPFLIKQITPEDIIDFVG